MRVALIAALAGALLAFASGTAGAADSNLGYGCDTAGVVDNCTRWHTAPFNLVWTYDTVNWEVAGVVGNDCSSPHPFNTDTAGTKVICYVWFKADHAQISALSITPRLDATAPIVTGMTPARAPDSNGWFNHPVALAFAGTDATSGIATCDTINYAGPEGDGVKVTGTCTDVAGNIGSASFPIKYDATPPTVTPGASDNTKVSRISLSWATSPDAVSSQVLRSPGIGGAPVSEVYAGTNKSFTDSAVTGGATYTYTINAGDQAGNIASTTMTIKAKAVPQASPAAARRPLLDWRRVRGADYYNVQLFRNGRKILSAWPRFSKLQLRKQWRYAGKTRKLSPGIYHWYVWPGYGPRAAHRYGKLITQKKFRVTAPKKPASGQAASRG